MTDTLTMNAAHHTHPGSHQTVSQEKERILTTTHTWVVTSVEVTVLIHLRPVCVPAGDGRRQMAENIIDISVPARPGNTARPSQSA